VVIIQTRGGKEHQLCSCDIPSTPCCKRISAVKQRTHLSWLFCEGEAYIWPCGVGIHTHRSIQVRGIWQITVRILPYAAWTLALNFKLQHSTQESDNNITAGDRRSAGFGLLGMSKRWASSDDERVHISLLITNEGLFFPILAAHHSKQCGLDGFWRTTYDSIMLLARCSRDGRVEAPLSSAFQNEQQ
jgi:hypothetical protein